LPTRCLSEPHKELKLPLEDALTLFKRLGVDVSSLTAREFAAAYFALAKRYHPDRGNQKTHELMANINAARSIILKCQQPR
jgi:DnaJ-class molecular chaperone